MMAARTVYAFCHLRGVGTRLPREIQRLLGQLTLIACVGQTVKTGHTPYTIVFSYRL